MHADKALPLTVVCIGQASFRAVTIAHAHLRTTAAGVCANLDMTSVLGQIRAGKLFKQLRSGGIDAMCSYISTRVSFVLPLEARTNYDVYGCRSSPQGGRSASRSSGRVVHGSPSAS